MITRILAARLYRGFVLLPTVLSVLGLFSAAVVIRYGTTLEPWVGRALPVPEIETLRALLGTIAGSALTVLSLVYSLTLVVFTLAAGNISPRLLTRFSQDRLIQVTAGVLAATFFYAIVMLQWVDHDADPAVTAAFALVWTLGSISLLIVFIHKVATRITIDEEIARIGAALTLHIEEVLEEASEEEPGDTELSLEDVLPAGPRVEVPALRSGYVEALDIPELVKTAKKRDGFLEIIATPGQFVVEGCALARSVGSCDESALDDIRHAFFIGRNRTPEADLDFSVLLMVEIAQRALSPGINDGFTAVAVIDHLSSAFARILRRHAPSPLYRDEQDQPRVWCRLAEIDRLLASAYHPLRREAADNVTVALRLIASLERLMVVSKPEYRPFLRQHVELIATDIRHGEASEVDKAKLLGACERILENFAETPDGHP